MFKNFFYFKKYSKKASSNYIKIINSNSKNYQLNFNKNKILTFSVSKKKSIKIKNEGIIYDFLDHKICDDEIKVVFFDFFGTLVNSAFKDKKFFKLLNLNEIETKKALEIIQIKNFNSIYDYLSYIEKYFVNMNKWIKYFSFIFEIIIFIRNRKNYFVYDEVYDILLYLKKKGIKLGLVSNIDSFHKELFYNLDLDKYFDYIYFSSDIGYKKPEYELYDLIFNNISNDFLHINKKNILFVGDNIENDFLAPIYYGFNSLLIFRDSNKDSFKNYIKSYNCSIFNLDDKFYKFNLDDNNLLKFEKSIKNSDKLINSLIEIKEIIRC